ncbi:MAG: extracellular solute-binding protein [Paenibacillus sp.]|nr:extracellular solute-binding protein [Paenibacillus sp.]
MLKRKNYWLLFAILLLSLTSLSPSLELNTNEGPHPRSKPQDQSMQPATGELGDKGLLHITVSLNDEEFRELKLISGRYTLTSGVGVDLKNIASEQAEQTLHRDLTIGDSPDIIMTEGRNILDLATQGYLLPVNVYQSAPGSTPLTGLIPLYQWNGYDWGVPLDIDPYVLVYSPQRLAELGMEKLPRSLEEWNTLLQTVRKDKGKYLLSMDTRNPYGYSALLESMGSNLLSEDMAPIEWTQNARSYFYLTSQYNIEVWDMLEDDTITIAIMPLSEWQIHEKDNLRAEAPLVKINERGLGALSSRCFALSAQSLQPEEAVTWLSYITSRTAQLEWLESTGRLPALDEVYRTGFRGMGELPFETAILLSEDTTTHNPENGGNWGKSTAIIASFLTSKIDAADYRKAIPVPESEPQEP